MNMLDNTPNRQVVTLTIAGSDSGGNAGIQADLRAFRTFGVHGCTAITALTAQNPFGVRSVLVSDAAFMGDQLDAVLEVYGVGALKTGMLATAGIIDVVASRLSMYNRIPKVIDPVMIATSGASLLEEDAVEALRRDLLPLASLITPNLPEAEVLLGKPIVTPEEQQEAARALADLFGCAVLVKGGHAAGMCAEDMLFDGERLSLLSSPRIDEPLSTHGTGCSLSAAVTASIACGNDLLQAVIEGKAYVYESIRTGVFVGEVATVLGTPQRLPIEEIRVQTL
jgi:hydroxymethylpyrimidine/phosphomethylpyrimidine kinase